MAMRDEAFKVVIILALAWVIFNGVHTYAENTGVPIGRYQAVVLPSGGGMGTFQLDSSWFILDTANGRTYQLKQSDEGVATWMQVSQAIGNNTIKVDERPTTKGQPISQPEDTSRAARAHEDDIPKKVGPYKQNLRQQ